MKRITSGVLAVLMFATVFSVETVSVFADPADQVQEITETTETTEATKPSDSTEATESTESTEATESTEFTAPSAGDTTEPTNPPEEKEKLPEKEQYDGRTISAEGMQILKLEEGFSKKPYWDYTQWTVGYGTCCPADKLEEYQEKGISEEAAEILLHNHLVGVYKDLASFAEKYSLTFNQSQYDALVLFSYNCGTGWTYEANGTLPTALRKGATGSELIRSFCVWCNAGGEIQSYLIRRRSSESYMYLEGKYAQTPPSNYTYVIYDANGGSVKPRVQGYNSNEPVAPFSDPTYSGYTFEGWYTQKNDGSKVTTLDASTATKTLYARWKDAQGDTPAAPQTGVDTTVTSDDVNVRKGPGTNYVAVGSKNKGDKIVVTETASGSGLRWGKFGENKWICLTYTDYDKVSVGTTTPSTPSGDTTTEPTTTPTTQPTTQPSDGTATKVMGTVNANGGLNIRSGAGTNHSIVGNIANKSRVEILEQQTVGGTVWGRISKGWICMAYVKLDSANSGATGTPGDSNTTTQSWSGTIINCTEYLNVRSGPGTNYAIKTRLKPGDKVTITEIKGSGSDGWGKIDLGWISMYYVKLGDADSNNNSDSNNTGSNNDTGSAKTGTITASELRIRSSAGTANTVVGYLNRGTKVTITQTTTVSGTTWGKISNGWISMDYVKLDSSEATTQGETKTVTASCLLVRNAAGTSGTTVVGYLYSGAKVTILEKTTVGGVSWGRISNGWICLSYVK